MSWYIIQVYSNSENRVADAIRDLSIKKGLSDKIKEIVVPTHASTQVRYGKKINVNKKFLPGYILINMELVEELFHLIKSIPRVSSFMGSNENGVPFPVSEEEIEKIMNYSIGKGQDGGYDEVLFNIGENVLIVSGPFNSFSGVIEDIESDKRKLKLAVSIFGRLTPVELEYHQVEKIKE